MENHLEIDSLRELLNKEKLAKEKYYNALQVVYQIIKHAKVDRIKIDEALIFIEDTIFKKNN
jgi:hypothetical protein